MGAFDVIQNVTFLGGAIDRLDREKTMDHWSTILSQTVPGTIKNVYTKKDFVLLEKLGLMNPQEIKYTWELESDSLSFD